MYAISLHEPAPDTSPGWGTQPGTEVRWVIDAERGATRGAVAGVDLEAGASQESHRHPGAMEAGLVLSGGGFAVVDGEEAAISPGSIVVAPAGASHAVRAGDEGLRLLSVFGGAADPAAIGWEASEDAASDVVVLSGTENEEVEANDHDRGFFDMHARWVLENNLVEGAALAIARSRFAPGGKHALHRHEHSEEFFLVLEGNGAHQAADGTLLPVGPGDIAFMARDEWHAFLNDSSSQVSAIFGYLGAGHKMDAGYELPS